MAALKRSIMTGNFGSDSTVRHPAISCGLLKDSTVKSNALIVQHIGITGERTHITNSPSCALHATPPRFALMPRDDVQFERYQTCEFPAVEAAGVFES
jgi:hypothetical protein